MTRVSLQRKNRRREALESLYVQNKVVRDYVQLLTVNKKCRFTEMGPQISLQYE